MNDKDKLEYEIRREAIDRAFRESPRYSSPALEKHGFHYIEEEDSGEEEKEERAATPQTPEQSALVEYFENGGVHTEFLLQAFIKEKQAESPNYALFRRYFKQGNERLKALLFYGLMQQPTNSELLSDVSFMHIFSLMLKELIDVYFLACEKETDPKKFKMLARDFYDNTAADGYNALHTLEERLLNNANKQIILALLQNERKIRKRCFSAPLRTEHA